MVYCVKTSMNTNKDSRKRIKKINNDTKLILIAVLVFLSGIQGVILTSSSSSSSSSSSYLGGQVFALQEHIINNKEKDENNNELSLSSLIKQGSPHLGDLSAPITIIDFSDFQCYLCARYVKETEPIIYETLIKASSGNTIRYYIQIRSQLILVGLVKIT
ncbi:MAG: bdbD 1 [Nitrososphaeraceae archaeon]|nr:bdbD 1 [Nitrososphaeraceae archaeon]